MAFALKCNISPVEFRAVRMGVGKNGPWMSAVFEDTDAQQLECSVGKEMQGDFYDLGLRKGDNVSIAIRAVARADGNSYIQLRALPELVEDEEA